VNHPASGGLVHRPLELGKQFLGLLWLALGQTRSYLPAEVTDRAFALFALGPAP
jgi:hypothetical protein